VNYFVNSVDEINSVMSWCSVEKIKKPYKTALYSYLAGLNVPETGLELTK
jgi:hypothetical protein